MDTKELATNLVNSYTGLQDWAETLVQPAYTYGTSISSRSDNYYIKKNDYYTYSSSYPQETLKSFLETQRDEIYKRIEELSEKIKKEQKKNTKSQDFTTLWGMLQYASGMETVYTEVLEQLEKQ